MEAIETTNIEANVAWKGDKPTPFIENSFNGGLIKSGQVVVDIGCGFGRNAIWLEMKGVKVTGININHQELQLSKGVAMEKGLDTNFIEGSATNLPLRSSSCDVAIDSGCSHMLSAEDQVKAAQEQARVLKPGGYLLFFGFSKDHPSATTNSSSPMYRNLDDVMKIYGNDFEVVSNEAIEWKPSVEENANFDMHKGINVVMKRKSNSHL